MSLFSPSNKALADYLNSEGAGGNYRYELWSTDDNSGLLLKVWLYEASPESDQYTTTTTFPSSREALIYLMQIASSIRSKQELRLFLSFGLIS